MRTLISEASEQYGQHPIYLIRIDWWDTNIGYYSDVSYASFKPIILGMSNVVYQKTKVFSADTSHATVTLDDTSGELKTILNTYDIHKTRVNIYLGFKDREFHNLDDDAILLMRGEISSPIIWSEQTRTLSFDVVSKVESRQLGFSPDQGMFKFLAPSAVDQMWPLAFGEAFRAKAFKVTERREAASATQYATLQKKDLHDIDEAYKDVWSAQQAYDNYKLATADDKHIPEIKKLTQLLTNYINKSEYLNNLIKYIKARCRIIQPDDVAIFDNFINKEQQVLTSHQKIIDYEKLLDKYNERLLRVTTMLETWGLVAIDKAKYTEEKTDLETKITETNDKITQEETKIETLQTEIAGLLNTIFPFALTKLSCDPINTFELNEPTVILINKLRMRVHLTTPTNMVIDQVLPTYTNINTLVTTEIDHFILPDDSTEILEGQYCHFKINNVDRIVYVVKQTDKTCYFTPTLMKKVQNGKKIEYTPLPISNTPMIESAPTILRQWIELFHNKSGIETGWDNLPDSNYNIALGDRIVEFGDEFRDIYILNCVPKFYANGYSPTSDNATSSVKEILGEYKGKIYNLPKQYYKLYQNVLVNDLRITYITVSVPLETLHWKDTIYSSFKSGAAGGSQNPADVMKYLILAYTFDADGYNVDDVSFNIAHNYLLKTPVNTVLTQRRNVYDVLDQLAFESRCALSWFNGLAYLHYLPAFNALATLDHNYIYNESLEVTLTDTEDLATEYIFSWKRYDLQDTPFKAIMRYNIPRYGTMRKEYTVEFFKHREIIEKMMTYWAIQNSNTFKYIKFTGPLNLMSLVPFDQIRLNIGGGLVATGAVVNAEVEQVIYNAEEVSVTVVVKTGIRAGEMEEYPWRWPYAVADDFPPSNDIQIAGGAKAGHTGPIGQDLKLEYATRPRDIGLLKMHDADEVDKPSLINDLSELEWEISEVPTKRTEANTLLSLESTQIFGEDTAMSVPMDNIFKVVKEVAGSLNTDIFDDRDDPPYLQTIALKPNILISGETQRNSILTGYLDLEANIDNKTWTVAGMPFLAKVYPTDNLYPGRIAAWCYEWEEIYINPNDGTIAHGTNQRTGSYADATYAINVNELLNTNAGQRFGNGVVYDANLKVPGTNLTIQKVPSGTIVTMQQIYNNGVYVHIFNVPNGTDGDCA